MLVFDPTMLGLEVTSVSGNEAMCRCPFHVDRHPSASFNVKTGLFTCYSCHRGMNANQLARKIGGEIKLIPAQKFQVATRDLIDMEWKHMLTFPLATGNSYLKKRKVTDKQVEEFGILQAKSGIIFPLKNYEGDIEGAIMRRYDGSPRYMFYGEKLPLWPLNLIGSQKKLTKIFIVEGVFGALRARRFDIPAFATLGASVNSSIKQFLQLHYPIAVFDNDYAGMLGAAKLISMVPLSKAVIPGMEADELDKDEWTTVFKEGSTTRSMTILAKLSKKPKEFHETISRFMAKQRGDRYERARKEEEDFYWG